MLSCIKAKPISLPEEQRHYHCLQCHLSLTVLNMFKNRLTLYSVRLSLLPFLHLEVRDWSISMGGGSEQTGGGSLDFEPSQRGGSWNFELALGVGHHIYDSMILRFYMYKNELFVEIKMTELRNLLSVCNLIIHGIISNDHRALPYITYTDMYPPTGSWFWSSCFRMGYPFQRRFLKRGILFRTQESSSFVSSYLKLFKDILLLKIRFNLQTF